jgi:hypothetical protein
LGRGVDRNVHAAAEALEGFVHAVPANDAIIKEVTRGGNAIGQLAHGLDVMGLEINLDIFTVDYATGGIVAAGKEEGEEGLGEEAAVVCGPDHGGE